MKVTAIKTLTLLRGLPNSEETPSTPEAVVTVCGACGTDIVLSEQQAILDFLGNLAGFLPDYAYFCPSCMAD